MAKMDRCEFGSMAGLALLLLTCACTRAPVWVSPDGFDTASDTVIRPLVVTAPVAHDSDDPAIWVHPDDTSQSLIVGTCKGGSIYAFDLDGKIVVRRSGMARINNVDIEYDFDLDGESVDVALATDTEVGRIRAFRLPELDPIDGGGIPVFVGEPRSQRRPMGIALYRRPGDRALFAIVSRKEGPSGRYLWQYRVHGDGSGHVRLTKVREFGAFSGGNSEIEAVAVDDTLGYVYYADELAGIRKYHADPDRPGTDQDRNRELALFGTASFAKDREGISIYRRTDGSGYILVSDQSVNRFRVFPREGTSENPHAHPEIAVLPLATRESDGSEVSGQRFGDRFPAGIFVAMSDDRTFHLYSWGDLAGDRFARDPTEVETLR